MSEDDIFARWSRRKRQVAREATPAPEPEPAPEAAVAEPATPEEETALLARLDLPRPEDATPEQIARFMQKRVPEFLRRRALRTLWRSNPILANLDGLNDYDEDFTAPEFNQKVLATAYQVGRGIVARVEAAAAAPETKGEPAPIPGEAAGADPVEPPSNAEAALQDGVAAAPAAAPDDAAPARAGDGTDTQAESSDFRPRRMRFET